MKALIFDYDGLIVDSEWPEFESWREIYQLAGTDLTPEEWTAAVGSVNAFDPKAHLEKATGRKFDWEMIDKARRQKITERLMHQPLLPGVLGMLLRGQEAGYRIGVASNSAAAWVEVGLERLGIRHLVETVRTIESVKWPKPHPEIYLRVIEDLNAETHETLAFEDSQPGVRAAKAAGLTVIAVPNALTKYHDLSLADQIIESLDRFELPYAIGVDEGGS
ncbi:MAG TPA: HAD-IA family hydrolase [Chthoniobacterales bacterium]